MSKHVYKKQSYVSVEMVAGYQQMVGVKPKTPIWFVCIQGRYGICKFSLKLWGGCTVSAENI